MTPVSKKPPLTPEEQAKQERRFYFHMGGLLCLLSPVLSIVYGTLGLALNGESQSVTT